MKPESIKTILLLLMLPLVMAATCEELQGNPLLAQGKQVPGSIPYSNEVMNAYVADAYVGTLTLTDKIVQGITCEPAAEPSYNIYVTSDDVLDVLLSGNATVDTVHDAMKNDDLRVEGTTMGKQVKMFFTNIAITLGSWFS